jgi:molecular chaperone GrpE
MKKKDRKKTDAARGAEADRAPGAAPAAHDAPDAADATGAQPPEGELEREAESVHERLAELERELEGVRAEAADAADRALRTLAEFDNFRRRSLRERENAVSLGAADVLRELLDVADNFDRALDHAGDDVPESFRQGMELVARGLHDLLDRKGVARMDAEGSPFDPERHEALTSAPAEGVAPNTVLQVVQPGYLLHERVLRPAKVIVSAVPSPVDAPTRGGDGEKS